jgi:hypothetical protein
MIAEWIAIYVVVFILCAVIVGRAPDKRLIVATALPGRRRFSEGAARQATTRA